MPKQTITVPIKLTSPNTKRHWADTYRINKAHKFLIRAAYNTLKEKPTLPCKITLTRIAPRPFDKLDNLPASLKHAIDTVADLLIPGLPPGRADSDSRLYFHCQQERGKPKEYALRIDFSPYWPDPITG